MRLFDAPYFLLGHDPAYVTDDRASGERGATRPFRDRPMSPSRQPVKPLGQCRQIRPNQSSRGCWRTSMLPAVELIGQMDDQPGLPWPLAVDVGGIFLVGPEGRAGKQGGIELTP